MVFKKIAATALVLAVLGCAPSPAPPQSPAIAQNSQGHELATEAVPQDRELAAKPMVAPALVYPPDMWKQGKEGRAEIECTVMVDGHTKDCVVIDSSDPAFGQAALAHYTHAKFLPAIRNGVVVEARKKWPATFKLDL